jgi:hypothetical protein
MSVVEPDDRSPYRGHRLPPEIIAHAVWLYFRFHLSFRDVQDLLAERGIVVSHEAIRQWCVKFGAATPMTIPIDVGGTGRLGCGIHCPLREWSEADSPTLGPRQPCLESRLGQARTGHKP